MLPAMLRRPLFDSRVLAKEVARHSAGGLRPTAAGETAIRNWGAKLSSGALAGYSETQLEQAFNQAVFVDLLGYVPIGAAAGHNLVPKRTAGGGRDVPDFVLGVFEPGRRDRWRAVGEIKAPTVNLDLPQTSRRSRETPVQQGFRYALNGEPGTEWIIVTNMREIRLYRNGYSAAHAKWTMEDLCGEERLTEFYVLLCRQNICPVEGESETTRILQASRQAGLDLTQGFYRLYDQARVQLLAHFRAQSLLEGTIKLDDAALYGKAHKLLNRVLFAAFCEDHPAGLMPDGTLSRVHAEAGLQNQSGAYWRAFTTMFSELDRGSPPGSKHAFNAFNGGLYAPDPYIDSLLLPDQLFQEEIRSGKHSMKGVFGFHVYDFAEELDVDSLGAIFEQSLKDLPHEAMPVRGKGSVEVTRRSQKGVFYTDNAITEYLTREGLRAVLEPIRAEVLSDVDSTNVRGRRIKVGTRALSADETRDVMFQRAMLERLKSLTVLDPACGSGAFLVRVFESLFEEYESVTGAIGRLVGQPLFGLDRIILRNNLFGVDVLSESVEIAKLSVWLRTASKTEPLEKLDKTIWAADSLRDSFPRQYDMVVSNPPWGAALDGWTDAEVRARFPFCGEEKDSYALFIIRAHEVLREGGILAYITPNSWLTTAGYSEFRRWFLDSFDLLSLVNVWKVFKDVNHDACMFVARKKSTSTSGSTDTSVAYLARGGNEETKWERIAARRFVDQFTATTAAWRDASGCRFETMYPPELAKVLDAAAKRSVNLGDICDVTVGIQAYHQRKVPPEVIEKRAFHSDRREGPEWFPMITGNEVQRYYDAPASNAYLRYSELLCDMRPLPHYKEERILVQQIFWNRIAAVLQAPSEPYLYMNTLFSCSGFSAKTPAGFVLAVLNSRIASAAYERWTNRLFGDKFPKISKSDLARFPMPKAAPRVKAKLHSLALTLGALWVNMKRVVTGFHSFASLAYVGTGTDARFRAFWAMSHAEAVAAVGSLPGVSAADKQALLVAWSTSVADLKSCWGDVLVTEELIETTVQAAYGFSDPVCAELLLRAPAVRLEDVLLPR